MAAHTGALRPTEDSSSSDDNLYLPNTKISEIGDLRWLSFKQN